jgi:peptide chain release factor 2
MGGSFFKRSEKTWKPNSSTSSKTDSTTSVSGPPNCGGIFDYDQKADELKAVSLELEDPKVWDDAERAQELGREKRSLENIVLTLDTVGNGPA